MGVYIERSTIMHTGLEFYVAPYEEVKRVCLKGRHDDLQDGLITDDFVLFPSIFAASELGFLESAVNISSEGPDVAMFLGEQEEITWTDSFGQEWAGLFIDIVNRRWIANVASLCDADAEKLRNNWI